MALMCRLIAGTLPALSLQSVPAEAQYPNKPITVIVPFAAGGPTDVVARLLGAKMGAILGPTLVIENGGGAASLSEPQIRSGQELRAGRHRQLHAAGDRLQEGVDDHEPQGLHRLRQS